MEHVREIPEKGGYAAIVLKVDKETLEEVIVKEIVKYVLDILKKEKNYNILLNNVKNNKKMDIEIYADSSYVLKGITEWIENWIKKDFKNVKNVELWKTLYSLKKQIEELPSVNLIFNKVKGHNRR